MVENYQKLIKKAFAAMQKSYSPYSNFKVGAALETDTEEIFLGTNIENASYGATVCAERTAIFSAVSKGFRLIKTLVVISELENYIYPCGICRQVIAEFSDSNTKIICTSKNKEFEIYNINDLIPKSFFFDFRDKL